MRLLKSVCLITALLAAPTTSFANSCSERQQVCLGYCAKSYNNAPRCLTACSNYMNECISTGCWESKIVSKQCGFTRR